MRRRARGWIVVGALTLLAVPALASAGGGYDAVSLVRGAVHVTERAVERVVGVLTGFFGEDAPAVATTVSQDGEVRWAGEVERGGVVEVRGVNGSVTAGPAPGDEVEVVARKRGRRSDPSQVRVEVVEHPGGVTVCAVYPTPEGEEPNVCAPGDGSRLQVRQNDVQVRFEIRVPGGLTLDVETVNGSVEALGLDGDARVRTVNGDVELVTSGFAGAETVNGSIRAVVGGPAFSDGVSFETVNGSIELDLPDDIDADLDASWVNGGLTTELPFFVQGVRSRRSARGSLGDGGPTLRLETVNGSIRIR